MRVHALAPACTHCALPASHCPPCAHMPPPPPPTPPTLHPENDFILAAKIDAIDKEGLLRGKKKALAES